MTSLGAEIVLELIRKSGVRDWESPEIRAAIIAAANEIAEGIEIMAASKQLVQAMDGTPKQIVCADHAGDFSPTAANDLRVSDAAWRENVQMAAAALADAAYLQTAKFDLGENRAPFYLPRLAVEITATPTAGNAILAFFAPSHSATAGTGNVGGVSGSAGAYTGYSSNAAASVNQLILMASFIITTQTSVQQIASSLGLFAPPSRYGSIVLLNGTGRVWHADDVEIHLVLDPFIPENQ